VLNLARLALEARHDSHLWLARLGSDRSSRTDPARVVITQVSAPIGTAHAFSQRTSKALKCRCLINAAATTWMRERSRSTQAQQFILAPGEIIAAGARVLYDSDGEVSKETLARLVFAAMVAQANLDQDGTHDLPKVRWPKGRHSNVVCP